MIKVTINIQVLCLHICVAVVVFLASALADGNFSDIPIMGVVATAVVMVIGFCKSIDICK